MDLQERYDIVCEENRQLKERLAAFVDGSFDPLKEMGVPGHFTPKDRQILCALWKHKGRVVPYSALMDAIYLFNEDRPENYDTIKTHVCGIRKQILPHGYKIQSDSGTGYKLNGLFES